MKNFQLPDPAIWTGRTTEKNLAPQYWYQYVSCNIGSDNKIKPSISLLGYECDAGVKRNQGRPGAVHGPNAIRNSLARLAYHHHAVNIIDRGNVKTPQSSDNMEAAQRTLADSVEQIISSGSFPIVFGGGHDMAYGHVSGLRAAYPDETIGILNFDAHFDLRPIVDVPNSGTPFNQLLEEQPAPYVALGIQKAVNPQQLYDIATEKKVKFRELAQCRVTDLPNLTVWLDDCYSQVDKVYITVDLDGFSAQYAPGVSAPSPIGLSPDFVWEVIRHLFQTGKVVGLDIAEMNPQYDIDGRTARLAALLTDHVCTCYTQAQSNDTLLK